MSRIISRNEHGPGVLSLVFAAALAVAACLGCSKRYAHKSLAAGSAERMRIAQLLAAVRQAGPAGLDAVIARDAIAELDLADRQRLTGSLSALAKADRADLIKADRFGRDICRATFQVASGAQVRSISILLKGEAAQLRWLQPN